MKSATVLLLLLAVHGAATRQTAPATSSGRRHGQHSQRPLLMGYADGLQLAELGAFVLSAHRFMPHAHIVLFMTPTTLDASIMRGLGVEVLDSDSVFVSLKCSVLKHFISEKCLLPHLHRFYLARSYLEKHHRRFSSVLTCDVRDTVFQANVFEQPAVHALGRRVAVMVADENPPPNASYGSASLTILQQPANRGWLKDCFGERVWPLVEGKPIVCSGYMLGHPMAVQRLAHDIVQTFQERCPRAPQHGLDQGILNWLVHVDRRPRAYELQVVPNGVIVLHWRHCAAHVTAAELHLRLFVNNIFQVVDNGTGQPYPAVHQYDRLASFKALFRGMHPITNVLRHQVQ